MRNKREPLPAKTAFRHLRHAAAMRMPRVRLRSGAVSALLAHDAGVMRGARRLYQYRAAQAFLINPEQRLLVGFRRQFQIKQFFRVAGRHEQERMKRIRAALLCKIENGGQFRDVLRGNRAVDLKRQADLSRQRHAAQHGLE